MRAREALSEGKRERVWEHYLHEHDQFNARLNFFLIAEAMLVVAAAQVLTSDEAKPDLGLAISVTGIGLTLIWAYVNRRQSRLIEFRRDRAIRALTEFAASDEARPEARVGSMVMLAYGVPLVVLIVWVPFLAASIADVA